MKISIFTEYENFPVKNAKSSKSCSFVVSKFWNHSASNVVAVFVLFIVIVGTLPSSAQGYNDEKGILKWNPYWFSNFRYSAPSSFYISPTRIGTPYKRLSDTMWSSGGSSSSLSSPSSGSGGGIYKWSPVYFSGGSAPSQPSSYLGGGGNGYMFSSNRPRWSLSDYGGSRFLTRYYGGNSYAPSSMGKSSSGVDLTSGSNNDLSALLGEEMMNNGLGLDNDAVDILDDNGPGISEQKNH